MKILQMVSALDGGGIERILFDYYSCMDHSKVQFDFVKVESEEGILERPLREMGCRIFSVPPIRKDHAEYCRRMKEILSQDHYDAIHCNGGYRAVEALRLAKQAGVPVRIAHAHTAWAPENGVKRLERSIATAATRHYATQLLACGERAGKWMWGENAFQNGYVTIVHNAIRSDRFAFDETKRNQIRMDLGIKDRFVVGNVGRFSIAKNHEFLLEVFAEVVKQRSDAVLLLIGRGELENDVKAQIRTLGLEDSVRLLGVRDDVPDLLNALDLFVLPSRWEGLPVTLVEVQANGLSALVSDTVTNEIKINPNVEYLPMDKDIWVRKISEVEHSRVKHAAERVAEAGYDISREAKYMNSMYQKWLSKV